MLKKLICLSLALSLVFILPIFAFADTYYDDNGYLTLSTRSYTTSSLYDPDSLPVYPSSVSIPDGYVYLGYGFYPDTSRAVWYFISPSDLPPVCYVDASGGVHIGSSSSPVSGFAIFNTVSANGDLTYYTKQNFSYYSISSGSPFQVTLKQTVLDNDGNVVRPINQVDFNMNTAFIGYNLVVNSQINSGDATSVTYYIFPASAPISGGSTSNIVPSTPTSELTSSQSESFLMRGFRILTYGIDDLITDIASPNVSLSSTSSTRLSSVFNPSSYGFSYELLGTGKLFPASGGGGISPSASLSLKDMISSHSGVYAYSTLKLVGVVTYNNVSFISTFDFAPAAIVGGSPVAPSTIQGQVPYPDFNNPNSDFKELADYLKQLMQANNDNSIRNNSNLLAMLNAVPWSNFVTGGFVNGLPNLSFMLDSLFDSLFDKFTAPSDEQINAILADINTERTSLRAKLAFVDDVKTEYYFVISTITADNNSVPPDFEFSLPSIWSGGQNIRVKLISYEIATPEIMANIKQVVTVFLSLALLLHIWRTLPATVGNMPRGDD